MVEILVGLLIVLGIVTVVGHAIWWMFATIIKALLGSSSEPAKQPILLSNECAGCGASLKFDDDFCLVCGRPQKLSSHADPLAELTIVIRQMDRFLNLGKIDPATHQQVINVIEEERERLVTPMQPPQSVKPAIETFEPVKAAPIIKPEPDAVDPISPSILDSMTKAPESDQLLEPAFVAPPTFDWDAADRFKKESSQVPFELPREPVGLPAARPHARQASGQLRRERSVVGYVLPRATRARSLQLAARHELLGRGGDRLGALQFRIQRCEHPRFRGHDRNRDDHTAVDRLG